jgi:hypothetical protein
MTDAAAEALGDLKLGPPSAEDKSETTGRQQGSVRWFNASKGKNAAETVARAWSCSIMHVASTSQPQSDPTLGAARLHPSCIC